MIESREHDRQKAVIVKHAVHSDSHYCGSSATGSEEGSEDEGRDEEEKGESPKNPEEEKGESPKNPKKPDVCSCAHSNGLPDCGFVKDNWDGETESQNVGRVTDL